MRPTPTGACLAVGSELLGDDRVDTNSLEITATLARYGIEVVEKRTVGDVVDRLATTIRELWERAEIVVITGGLGPTADDVTRDAVAVALNRDLEHMVEVEGWIGDRFAAFDRPMPEVCRKMAKVVRGGRPLHNALGTAPGLLIEDRGRMLVALPGVPAEVSEMLERHLVPELERRYSELRRATRRLVLGGVVESRIEERVAHLYERFGRDTVTILAKCGVVRLLLSAMGDEASTAARLDEMEAAFRGVLGDDVAGVDVDGLADTVLELLGCRGETLVAAESCTGGLLASMVTDVPGASSSFLGGVVSYSDAVKQSQLGVPAELLAEHGAVSQPVAEAMAEGVRGRFGADWGVGITGIAGPGGGTDSKPVGLVHWAVAGPSGVVARHEKFPGDRAAVRLWSVHAVLDLLRRRLMSE